MLIYLVVGTNDSTHWNVHGYLARVRAEEHAQRLNKEIEEFQAALKAWEERMKRENPYERPPGSSNSPEARDYYRKHRDTRTEWIAKNPVPIRPYSADETTAFDVEALEVTELDAPGT